MIPTSINYPRIYIEVFYCSNYCCIFSYCLLQNISTSDVPV